jgi:MYXO-CTERM domain-containing protein
VGFDLLSIITHETGHMLGIAHSRVPDSTMGREYLPGDLSLRDLATDDVAAICAVYPPVEAGAPGDPASCDPTPRHGFTGECGPFPEPEDDGCAVRTVGPGQGLPWGLGAGLLALGLRRRARREG